MASFARLLIMIALSQQIASAHRTENDKYRLKALAAFGDKVLREDLGPYYTFDPGFHIDASLEFRLENNGMSWVAGDASGNLSSRVDVHLPERAISMGLSEDAVHGVAWAYPDKKYASKDLGESTQDLFKKTGGYVYFGSCAQVVAVRGVASASRVMKLGAPEECPNCNLEQCPGSNGFMQYPQVTMSGLRSTFTNFCWLPPESCSRVSYHQDGCFAYKKKDAYGFLLYPVSTEQAPGSVPSAIGPFLLASLQGKRPSLNVSQWTAVTVPSFVRAHVTIPQNASSFTWAYPVPNSEVSEGGFVYSPGEILKRVVPTEAKIGFGLAYGSEKASEVACSTWHTVMEQSEVSGAKRYCWSMHNGGGSETFSYEMDDGSVVSYTVA